MPVPQQLISLLNLPVSQLRLLALRAGVVVEDDTKWGHVVALADLQPTLLDEVVGEWIYAGQTSITWFRLGEGQAISLDELTRALTERYGRNPFEQDVRPEEVTDRPELIAARTWEHDKVVFTFAVTGRVTRVIHNFETHEYAADEFFIAVLRLEPAVLEVRASHTRAIQLASEWLPELVEHLDQD